MEWKPIDTAPRDGTEILLCSATNAMGEPTPPGTFGLFVQRASWWQDADVEEGGEWVVYCSLPAEPRLFFEPTHWMPIPDPPNPNPNSNPDTMPTPDSEIDPAALADLIRAEEDEKRAALRSRVANDLSYHKPPNDAEIERVAMLRRAALNYASLIIEACPLGRDLSQALSFLEQASRSAIAAVAKDWPRE